MPRDPVCGMTVHALWAPAEAHYNGRRFFFCSLACQAAFRAAPERYIPPTEAWDAARPNDDCPFDCGSRRPPASHPPGPEASP